MSSIQTARMLASKSRELIEDCSSSKRKAGDSDVDIKKEEKKLKTEVAQVTTARLKN